jgi:hypothetical protein
METMSAANYLQKFDSLFHPVIDHESRSVAHQLY